MDQFAFQVGALDAAAFAADSGAAPLCDARMTQQAAGPLATLAQRLAAQGHPAEAVAAFLLRCLFTLFAEGLGLVPPGRFIAALLPPGPAEPPVSGLKSLWDTLRAGPLTARVLQHSGGLFRELTVLPVDSRGLALLQQAARCDFSQVEPAIFGMLLECALSPRQRHAQGTHYTPRAYIERLVRPTIEEPLRADWQAVTAAVQPLVAAAAVATTDEERAIRLAPAVVALREFQAQLGRVRVLDPACGAGNFLYVTLDLLQRLEAEVLQALASLSPQQAELAMATAGVWPGQLLGLEVNPWARDVAELVLWVSYLQRHFHTYGAGRPVPERIFAPADNLECRDAILAYQAKEQALDAEGQPATHWDGQTYRTDAVTAAQVPAESAQVPRYRYRSPRPASWPAADFVVGNPPFIGNRRMRTTLGDGYVQALREAYPQIPPSVDFVMYWWHKAAELTRQNELRRFGLITTKALAQKLGQKVLRRQLEGSPALSLVFAIPNHPWQGSVPQATRGPGADVRIAMTVAQAGRHAGTVWTVSQETVGGPGDNKVVLVPTYGVIHADLTVGADLTTVRPLRANRHLCSPGVKLHGAGFIVTAQQAADLGLGTVAGTERQVRPYRNGKDLLGHSRQAFAIDLYGLTESELQSRFPRLFQWTHERVRSPRLAKSQGGTKDAAEYAKNWWQFGKSRLQLRRALAGLPRYIATVETTKHRVFLFLDQQILADNMIICVASADALVLATLSSAVHTAWARASGGRMGVGNDSRYNKTRCFDPFPFPRCDPQQRQHLRDLGERLDAHRKQQQLLHPELTITGIYNVLDKLRRGQALSAGERITHDRGGVAALHQLHCQLDAAVGAAYGFAPELKTEEILQRLVRLNAERAQEEQSGVCHFVRPEFQSRS